MIEQKGNTLMTDVISRLVDSRFFQTTVMVVILAAAVVVGLETYPQIMARHGTVILVLDWIIMGLFIAEAVLKMARHGRGWYRYFADPWNVFDFTIIVVCLIPFAGHFAAVLRLARVMRALRLISALPKLQLLVSSLIKSIPSMGYVGLLLGLLFYVYAVLGVSLFRDNDPVHFGNLKLSLLTLFRVVTLEDWTDVMYIQMFGSDVYQIENPTAEPIRSHAQPLVGALFFVTFILIGTMVMLNLFIGVIINSMQDAQRELLAVAVRKRPRDVLTGELQQLEHDLETLTERVKDLRHRARHDADG